MFADSTLEFPCTTARFEQFARRLNDLVPSEAAQELLELRSAAWKKLQRLHWKEPLELLEQICSSGAAEGGFAVENGVVSLGRRLAQSAEAQDLVQRLVRLLIPWRKGPFRIGDIGIDAEWRSDLKWERIVSAVDSLSEAVIADVGASNGYYIFRALEHRPKFVVGFDPSERSLLAFELVRAFAPDAQTEFIPASSASLNLLPSFFDITLCLGVIYHVRHPLLLLHELYESLRPGGQVIVESIVVPGSASTALFPEGRYCKLGNVYFLPTSRCLAAMMQRAGFRNVEIVSETVTTSAEQRKTAFSPYESLTDFLDPTNPSLTVEGHPAPVRAVLAGRKPR